MPTRQKQVVFCKFSVKSSQDYVVYGQNWHQVIRISEISGTTLMLPGELIEKEVASCSYRV